MSNIAKITDIPETEISKAVGKPTMWLTNAKGRRNMPMSSSVVEIAYAAKVGLTLESGSNRIELTPVSAKSIGCEPMAAGTTEGVPTKKVSTTGILSSEPKGHPVISTSFQSALLTESSFASSIYTRQLSKASLTSNTTKELTEDQKRLQSYSKRLLDLSMRNNLLNYRDRKTGTLRIIEPELVDCYKYVVLAEHPMMFRNSMPRELGAEQSVLSPSRPGKYSLVTERTPAELVRCLRRLDTVARGSIEEQGIGILYLGLGLLKWIDSSGKEHEAPLVLAPVQLARASARSSFVLRAGDDDPIVNPTLAFFLNQVYGITLPEFEKDDRIDEYLIQVARLIAEKQGWGVTYEVVLSTFQFQKISMYHDLQTRSSEIVSHPIVRAVMGDGSSLEEPIQAANPDDLLPTDTYQVVDADTSQQQAIIAAHKGASFVLQGPPGTGKSQTITNIIADSLAMGKKVLFVSEKKAALDVVHNRLKQVMLDDFCLVLHSNKLGKKEVLAQLDHTLKLYGTQTQVDPMANMRLNDLVHIRKHLNDYASEIYTVIEPLSMSPYDVIGKATYFEQEGIPYVTCKMDFLETVGQEGLEERREALREYAQALEDVDLDPSINPWVEFGVTELGYGEGYELLSRMQRVSRVTRDLVDLRNEIQKNIGLSISNNLYGMKDTADLLSMIETMPVVPQSLLGRSSKTLLELIENDVNADGNLKALGQRILDGSAKLEKLNSELRLNVDESQLNNKDYVQGLRQSLSDQISVIDYCSVWSKIPRTSVDSVVSRLRVEINEYEKVRNSILEAYHPEVFDIDYIEMEARFKVDYQSFFKRMFGQRSADLRTLTACRSDGSTVDDEEATRILGLLHQLSNMARALDERRDRYVAALGSCYVGVNTDFTQIELRRLAFDEATGLLVACESLLKECDEYFSWVNRLSQTFTSLFDKDNPNWRNTARETVEKISSINGFFTHHHGVKPNGLYQLLTQEDTASVALGYKKQLIKLLADGDADFNALSSRFGTGIVYDCTLDDLLAKSTATSATDENAIRLSLLYNRARTKCVDLGLEPFLAVLERDANEVSRETLEAYPDIFSQTFYRAWLEQVAMRECPSLRYFSARSHEKDIERFADLDRDQVAIDRDRVLAKLFANIPTPNGRARGRDEMSILMRELRKKARIRPIRKLFADIPTVLLALKPCLMMSPLSVSTYLESAAFKFDIVIFDEASQVRTEDALGVISRGKQVIIAGDSKQLPPTNFFAATVSEEGDEEDEDYYDQVGSFDSVLDEAVLLDSMSLTWHYRSRDESLIAFSNDEIYESELFTFPQSRISGKDSGVEYRFVPDGVYEGSRKGNAIEAKRVADLVLEHFATYGTQRSLGVIALGESQSRVIESELLHRRLETPGIEKFFDQSLEEPFFVKNLENVQGDERDTIILSIGYGKNAQGRLSHNFGPINMDGGERRLNVAVTRARMNLKLVSSIDATQIDPSKVSNIGPRVLRDYLAYAKQGSLEDVDATRCEYGYVAHDSFADVIKRTLEARGFDVAEKSW